VTEHYQSIQESGGLDSINIAAKPDGGDETAPFGRSFISSSRFQFRERGLCVSFTFGRRSGYMVASEISGEGSERSFENASRRQGCVAPADSRLKFWGGATVQAPSSGFNVGFILRDACARSG
jgi:hypothetical protein